MTKLGKSKLYVLTRNVNSIEVCVLVAFKNQEIKSHTMIDFPYLSELLQQETKTRLKTYKQQRGIILAEVIKSKDRIIGQLDLIQKQIENILNQAEAEDSVIPIYQQMTDIKQLTQDNIHIILTTQILNNQRINQQVQNQIEFILSQQVKEENKLLLTVFASDVNKNAINYEIQNWDILTQNPLQIYQQPQYYIEFNQQNSQINLKVVKNQFELKGHLIGHTEEIWPIAISNDDKYLASGCYNKTEVFLWNLLTHKVIKQFKGPNNLSFSQDNKRLAVAGQSPYTIFVFDITTDNSIPILLEGHYRNILRTAFTHDSKYLISGSVDQSLRIWDLQKGKQISQKQATSYVYGLTVSKTDQQIAFCDHQGFVYLYDTKIITQFVKQLERQAHKEGSNCIEFISNSQCLLTSGKSELRLWKVEDLLKKEIQFQKEIRPTQVLWTVKAFPNWKPQFVIGCDGTIKIWDLESGRIQQIIEIEGELSFDSVAHQFVFSSDFTKIFVGGLDKRIKIYQKKR